MSVINDENRSSSAAFHQQQRSLNNVPSVNGGTIASPPTSHTPNAKPTSSLDPFDRDLPSNGTTDSHHSGGMHSGDSFFLSQLMSGDELPDLSLAGAGSLDELLPNDGGTELSGAAFDIGHMLEEMSHQINGDCRQQLDSLDFFDGSFPTGGGPGSQNGARGDVKCEPMPSGVTQASFLDDMGSFGPDATGSFSARSAPLPPLTGLGHGPGHHTLSQRITPDALSAKQRLSAAQDEQQMLLAQQHQQQHQHYQQQSQQKRQQMLQHQAMTQQQFQAKTGGMSPFGPGGGPEPPPGMCFSPGSQGADGMPAGYAASGMQHNGGYPGGPGRPYGQVMRMNQAGGSPGVAGGGGGRWPSNDAASSSIPFAMHQQQQMSLVSSVDLPYGQPGTGGGGMKHTGGGGPMTTAGGGGGGPGKQPVFLQGERVAVLFFLLHVN